MINDTDRLVRLASEALARRLQRRRFLGIMASGAFSGLAALASGHIRGSLGLAYHCDCEPPQQTYCQNCPSGYPWCPSGYQVCTTSSGCIPCIYATGYWNDSCDQFCYWDCFDCWKPSQGCSSTCGCKILHCSYGALKHSRVAQEAIAKGEPVRFDKPGEFVR
jgi:hypothetical protein